jgi:hypothetical protein
VRVKDALAPNTKRVVARLSVMGRQLLDEGHLVLGEIALKHSDRSGRNFSAYAKERGTCSIPDLFKKLKKYGWESPI